MGELAEIFQWKGECQPGLPEFTPAEKVHVAEEISDVLLYLVGQIKIATHKLGGKVLRYPIAPVGGHTHLIWLCPLRYPWSCLIISQ